MIHGGDPTGYAKARGLRPREVLDFSVNLNPLGPPKSIDRLWKDLKGLISAYPPLEADGIKSYYEARFHVPNSMVVPGNGSTELIYLIPRALRPNSTLIFEPTYSDYKRACSLAGVKVMCYQLNDLNSFEYPKISLMEDVIKNVDSVWIGRPNNPTGRNLSKADILYLARRYPEKLFILDESFIQFLQSWSSETFISKDIPQNVIVIHSLTKFYAIAGIRVGAAIANRHICESLLKVKEPWTVNSIANRIAYVLSEEEEYEKMTRRFVKDESMRIAKKLKLCQLWELFEGEANFFLIRWKGSRTLDEILDCLYENGLFVRDARNFKGLEDNFIRIGLRSSKDNDFLLSRFELIQEVENGCSTFACGIRP